MFKELGKDIGRPAEPVNRQDSLLDRVAMWPIPVVVRTKASRRLNRRPPFLADCRAAWTICARSSISVVLLIQREDMRFRLISLMGDAALTGTTRLMRDTAERVSNYLLGLFIVNAGFGLWFGIGLYLLEFPMRLCGVF